MGSKIKFVGMVLVGMAVVYILLTAFMPFISGMAFDTANNTSVADFPSAQAGLRWTPIILYTVPGVVGLTLIVLKLRSGGKEA